MDQAWIQVDIYTTTEGLDILGSALSDVGYPSFLVTDADDFKNFLEGNYGAWDYFHSDILKLREAETTVTVYLPSDTMGQESLAAIRKTLSRLKASDQAGELGRLEYSASSVIDEDWANSWKKHHKPVGVGKKLLICPSWVHCCAEGRIVLRLDPGMAFGTGADMTTRLCLEALEDAVEDGCSVLDVGCGSGILAIAALLLGAGSALGVDADRVAVESALGNAELNNVSDRCMFISGDLADSVTETYDIICANISADAILTLAPDSRRLLAPRGLLILSGIIENRAREVTNAYSLQGLVPVETKKDTGWVCIVLSNREARH